VREGESKSERAPWATKWVVACGKISALLVSTQTHQTLRFRTRPTGADEIKLFTAQAYSLRNKLACFTANNILFSYNCKDTGLWCKGMLLQW